MGRTNRLARAACKAAVYVQSKARIHRNASAGDSTHQGNAPARRIGFGQGYAVRGAMRQTETTRDATVGFGD